MKVFCIGFNKTGTTSLSQIFWNNNFSVAPQEPFEYNLESYFYKNYSTYINMIKDDYYSDTLFQDVPFALPDFYKTLDKEFPNSKFILTIRDNEDEWYNSLIRFYKSGFLFFNQPKIISGYVYEGIVFKYLTKALNSPKTHPYDEISLKNSYLNHIKDVKTYFKDRKDDLLVINLKDKDVIFKLEHFLDIKFNNKEIPHLNKSK